MDSRLAACLACLILVAPAFAAEFDWHLPPGFPAPRVPEGNPVTAGKVALGRRLFYDKRLSVNQAIACGSCHSPSRSFVDEKGRSAGAFKDSLPRDTLPLVNLAYRNSFGWADASVRSLERQMQMPLFNDHPVEMGLTGNEAMVLARIRNDRDYLEGFDEAFPGEPITIGAVIDAIAAFERTLISGRSAFDRWLFSDVHPSDEAVRGFRLFRSERLRCNRCHGGIGFNGDFHFRANDTASADYFDMGLGGTDKGLFEATRAAADRFRFRVPTLRNIAVTAPYMHDGRFRTLDEVIDHYAAGPNPAEGLSGFRLTARERSSLIAFLNLLTDDAFLSEPRFQPPQKQPAR